MHHLIGGADEKSVTPTTFVIIIKEIRPIMEIQGCRNPSKIEQYSRSYENVD